MSLVEVLVALAVLGLGIYALGDLLGATGRTAALADQALTDQALAMAQLESLRAAPDELAAKLAGTGAGQIVQIPGAKPAPVPGRPDFQWMAWASRDAGDGSRINLRVEVTRAGGKASPAARPAMAAGFVLMSAKKGGEPR